MKHAVQLIQNYFHRLIFFFFFFPSHPQYLMLNVPIYSELCVEVGSSTLGESLIVLVYLQENIHTSIQCVYLDSPSFVIYPEIKATEVKFSSSKRFLLSFYFRIYITELVESKETHCTYMYTSPVTGLLLGTWSLVIIHITYKLVGQTDRQTGRHGYTGTDRQTGRQADRLERSDLQWLQQQ